MHMLRDEDNANYRLAIKKTLEFDPQILRRYVNFMNNPDEKTAVEQFGNGDKYFGVCTMLSTLPGLPMFGHGQIEGFHEKYGMEFRRAKWEETIDEGLIRGHEWKIFPLLHRRYLFADVEQFHLYDFYKANGSVDEDVFAYSNCLLEPHEHAGERSLIIYHNKFSDTRGWIRTSAAAIDKTTGRLTQKSMGDGLHLPRKGFAIFRDYVTHKEYIRSCREILENGLYLELSAYECHVFMEWRFVEGDDWSEINNLLNGAGIESIQAKWEELFSLVNEVKREARANIEVTVKVLKRKKTAQVRKNIKTSKKSKPESKKSKKNEPKVRTKIVKKNTIVTAEKKKTPGKIKNSTKAKLTKPVKRKASSLVKRRTKSA
jgi:hypothetical protein